MCPYLKFHESHTHTTPPMNTFVSTIAFFSLLLLSSVAPAKASGEQPPENVIESCMSQWNATKDEFDKFPVIVPQDQRLKCVIKCCLDAYSMISDEGVVNPETAFRAVLRHSTLHKEHINLMRSIIYSCSRQNNQPVSRDIVCSKATDFVVCVANEIGKQEKDA